MTRFPRIASVSRSSSPHNYICQKKNYYMFIFALPDLNLNKL